MGILAHPYKISAGQPLFRSETLVKGEVRGNFTVYLWEFNGTVFDGNGSHPLWSGYRWDNAIGPQIGPRGIARDEHWLLLDIRLVNATLDWHVDGVAKWIGPRWNLETTGTVNWAEAKGALESETTLYPINQANLAIDGEIHQTAESGIANTELNATLTVYNARLNARGFPLGSEGEVVKVLRGGASVWTLVLLVAATVVATGVFISGLHRVRARRTERRLTPTEKLELGQHFLEEGRIPEAKELAATVVSEAPHLPFAWELYGAALLELGRYDEIVTELLPRVEKEPGLERHLAFPVAAALAALRRPGEVLRWARVVVQDPQWRPVLQADPRFETCRQDPAFRRLLDLDPGFDYA